LIFVDVNLGKDKGKQKLVVYEGESPLLAARKFAEKFDVKEEKVALLEKLLR
jgi:hypothetical protein